MSWWAIRNVYKFGSFCWVKNLWINKPYFSWGIYSHSDLDWDKIFLLWKSFSWKSIPFLFGMTIISCLAFSLWLLPNILSNILISLGELISIADYGKLNKHLQHGQCWSGYSLVQLCFSTCFGLGDCPLLIHSHNFWITCLSFLIYFLILTKDSRTNVTFRLGYGH